jgi:hypothetical protein
MRLFGCLSLALVACTPPPPFEPFDLSGVFDLSVPRDMANADDMAASPALVPGEWGLFGWFDEANLVVYNRTSKAIALMPIAGGTMTAMGNGDSVSIASGAVFIFTDIDASVGLESLDVWTVAGGRKPLSTASSFTSPTLSNDGQYALYFDAVSVDGKLGSLVTSKLDGTARMTAATGVPTGGTLDTADCSISAWPLGSAFAFAWCTGASSDPDMGAWVVDVTRFHPVTGARLTLQTGMSFIPTMHADAARTHVALIDASGAGIVYDAAGNPTQFASQVWDFRFRPDGQLLFTTTTPTLVRYDVLGKTTTTLQSPSATWTNPLVFGFSPDGNTVMFSQNNALTTLPEWDLYGASTVSTGAIATYSATATASPGGGGRSLFTDDNQWALFSDNVGATVGAAQLNVVPVTGASSAPDGGVASPVAPTVNSAEAAGGSRLVVCGNYDSANDACDIFLVNATTPTAHTPVATHVIAPQVLLSPNKSKVAWAIRARASEDGVYVLTLP